MAKRMILMLLALGALLTLLAFVKYSQVQGAIAEGASFAPPPEAVTTVVAGETRWPATLGAIGTVVADKGVVVSADLPGIVECIEFESGRAVSAGTVLVRLDTKQERAQLSAAEATRDLARLHLARMTELRGKGVSSQSELDAATAAARETEARVEEIQATIARKTIRAPFSGWLGIRQVNLGQYLTGGAPIVPLQSLQPIHVDFSVPQQEVARLAPGTEVAVALEGGEPMATGRVSALDSVVDAGTRNALVRATFDNAGGALRPGMFVETELVLGLGEPIIALPASAVSYAPYGNSVFIVEELEGPDGTRYQGVRQQFVRLGQGLGDQVAVLEGIAPGEVVVTSGVFKLTNGAAVQINNEVQPGNDPAPAPENS